MYQLFRPQPGGPEIKYLTLLLITALASFLFSILPWNFFWSLIRLLIIHDFYMLLKAISSKGGTLEPLPSVNIEEGQQVIPSIRYETANGEICVSWCPTCHFYKPPTAHHCRVCNRCVDGFDHHCLWLNNCVDTRTQHYFFWVLFDSGVCALFSFLYLSYQLFFRMINAIEWSILSYSVTLWDKLLLLVIVGCIIFFPACNKFQRQLLMWVMGICGLLILVHMYFLSEDLFRFVIISLFGDCYFHSTIFCLIV